MNYSEKLRKLQERQEPKDGQSLENFSSSIYESTKIESEVHEARKYVKRAMEELPSRSTEISYEEGERVKFHLMEQLPNYGFFNPEFKYQGSVRAILT